MELEKLSPNGCSQALIADYAKKNLVDKIHINQCVTLITIPFRGRNYVIPLETRLKNAYYVFRLIPDRPPLKVVNTQYIDGAMRRLSYFYQSYNLYREPEKNLASLLIEEEEVFIDYVHGYYYYKFAGEIIKKDLDYNVEIVSKEGKNGKFENIDARELYKRYKKQKRRTSNANTKKTK